MPASANPSTLESLESRRHATSTETISTVVDDPNPTKTVIEIPLSQTRGKPVDPTTVARLRIVRNALNDVTVQGNVGDDSVRVRVTGQGLEIRTTTRQTYRYYTTARGVGRQVVEATSTFENVATFARGTFSTLTINGGKGSDSLRYAGGLPFVVATTSVERETPQTYAPAPAGQTPSDPAPRPGRGWATLVANERARADALAVDPAAADPATSFTAFFGDSYVANLPTFGNYTWQQYFRRGKNFGIGGDTTRNALYRIVKNGLFDHYKPHKLVVSIGTNDLNTPRTGGTDEQIYKGIVRVMNELRKRLPDTHIVLMSLIPRNGAGLNARVEAINAMLDQSDFGEKNTFLNLYGRYSLGPAKFNQSGDYGGSPFEIALVGTDSHYTPRGYRILGYHLKQVLDGL